MAILLDASLLCAYSNVRDVHHLKAKNILENISKNKYGEAIITDYVFDEIVSVIIRKLNKDAAINFGNIILSSLVLGRIDSFIFNNAWQIFSKANNFSFTDCTNLSFMKIYGINKIATFDKEFKKVNEIEVVDL